MNPQKADGSGSVPRPSFWRRIIVFVITTLCFVYLYYRLVGAAARELSLIHI